MTAGTNEVAMWALQLYITPFAKIPHAITGSQGLYLLIYSHQQDQDPATHTVTFPESPSIPGPWGCIFLTSHLGTHVHVQNYQITFIHSLSSFIVHIGYSILMCAGTWSSKIKNNPFRYMIDTGM
jgi:hypothetical protein